MCSIVILPLSHTQRCSLTACDLNREQDNRAGLKAFNYMLCKAIFAQILPFSSSLEFAMTLLLPFEICFLIGCCCLPLPGLVVAQLVGGYANNMHTSDWTIAVRWYLIDFDMRPWSPSTHFKIGLGR